jgi:sigma-B regulation protein RsbU (phosphoserine phosphatase)
MSSVSQPTAPNVRVRFGDRLRNFWLRVSDGLQVDDLWRQFVADARAGYGFYGREVDWDNLQKLPHWRQPLYITRQFFWALLLKLTAARRILLLVAFVFLAVPNYQAVGVILLLALLLLELADKVIMKRDLEIAREIQSWLVPSQPPEVPGADIAFTTRPQNSVAGDYFDAFFPNPEAGGESRLMIVIADVAGKSIPAALLMATLQASLRTIAGDGAPLADLVARLNRYASAHSLHGERFTTAVLSEYNPQTRRLTYVNAGHNPPILRRGNGTLEKLEVGGLPLGIQSPAAYETASVDLLPGDALIFYTDGVVEAFNDRREEFGNDRWSNAIRALPLLNAQDSLRFLMEPVDQFVGATHQSDDITYLVLCCK